MDCSYKQRSACGAGENEMYIFIDSELAADAQSEQVPSVHRAEQQINTRRSSWRVKVFQRTTSESTMYEDLSD